MAGILAGTYRCKVNERLYTFDARWEVTGETVRWTASVKLAHATSRTSGELTLSEDADANPHVTRAVNRWIEAAICTGGALPATREWGD